MLVIMPTVQDFKFRMILRTKPLHPPSSVGWSMVWRYREFSVDTLKFVKRLSDWVKNIG